MESVIIVRYLFDEFKFKKYVETICEHYHVFIYDNSPMSLLFKNNNVTYFSQSKNIGLMSGLNVCIEDAKKKGFSKCVYFDQDSDINLGLIRDLFNSYDELKKKDNNVFAIGPLPMVTIDKPYPIRVITSAYDHYYKATEIITSGMVFNPLDVHQIGLFRDDFYVDWGDYEICWRAQKFGKSIYVDKNIKMLHEVGINYIKIFNRVIPFSSPMRNYYQTRNITYSLLHGLTPHNRMLALYYFMRRALNVLINILFIAPRYTRLKYSIKGYIDGVRGKLGKYKD